ncbi:MAG: OstA-like protein [Luteibaculaceae bacterium]
MCRGNYLFLLCCICFLAGTSLAQGQAKRKIDILHADVLKFDEKQGIKAQRLIGNVKLFHEGTTMLCDSAYLYPDRTMEAFGNVKAFQPGKVTLTAKFIDYNGNNQTAYLKENGRVENDDFTLDSDFLTYNLAKEVATYKTGGVITNKENGNVLISDKGVYRAQLKKFFFSDSVKMITPQYTVYSDTLIYATETELAFFPNYSLTVSEKERIEGNTTWYYINEDKAAFRNGVNVYAENSHIYADSLFYDRGKQIGEGFYKVMLLDTLNKVKITGQYLKNNQQTGKNLVTGRALLAQLVDNDTLFISADTLRSVEHLETKQKTFYAYYRAGIFKTDLQGRCDSLVYSEADSLVKMYRNPILWSEESQITGKHIQLKNGKNGAEKLYVFENSFIVSLADPGYYNQIKGRNITGFFSESQLKKLLVEGNGETIYFPKDDPADTLLEPMIIGMNKAICSNIEIRLNEGQVSRIKFLDKPLATLHTLEEMNTVPNKLKGFKWLGNERPKSKYDLFPKKEEELSIPKLTENKELKKADPKKKGN